MHHQRGGPHPQEPGRGRFRRGLRRAQAGAAVRGADEDAAGSGLSGGFQQGERLRRQHVQNRSVAVSGGSFRG